MRITFFTILLLIIFSLNNFGQTVTKEEYEVYSIVLNHIHKDNVKNGWQSPFVILDKTKNSDGWESLNKGTHKDFKKKNRISVQLNPVFPIKYQYWVVEKDAINNLIEMGRRDFTKIQEERKLNKRPLYAEPDTEVIWKHFNEKYSNAWGYYQFSRIGFDSNKNYAKVEVEYESDGGFRMVYLLNKSKRKWKIIESTGVMWSH